MKITRTFTPRNTHDWRMWLEKNHEREGKSGWCISSPWWEEGIDYETSVEETLCFGWIDSIIQKIDEEKYTRKFNPRRMNGKWSETNKPWKRWCRSFLKAAKWFYWVMPSTIPPK